MNKKFFSIKGIRWFRDIVVSSSREYGIEVHRHLPQTDIEIEPYGYEKEIVRLPEQARLIRSLSEYFGRMPAERRLPDAYAASIEDSTIVGTSGMIVTPDGYLIAETASMIWQNDGRSYTLQQVLSPSFNPPNKGHFKGRMLSLANPNGGYSHHLLESFAAMFWFYGCSFTGIHTAAGPNNERITEFLEALNLSTDILTVTGKDEILSADYVSFFAPCSNIFLRKETVDMVHRLLVAPNRVKSPAVKRIFCDTGVKTVAAHSRTDSNLNEFKRILKDENFEFVDLANFNVIEKIRYLSQVDIAVTMFGSAAANLYLLAGREVKWLPISPANAMTVNSVVANFPVPGYTELPLLPVFKEFWLNGGNLMTGSSVLWCRNAAIDRLPSGVFHSSMPSSYIGNFCSEIDLDKFKEFFKLFLLHYA